MIPSLPFTFRPSLEELQAGSAILQCGRFAFFAQCWRINAANPLLADVSGALFFYAGWTDFDKDLSQPRCILGGDPTKPAHAVAALATVPDGPVASWSARELASQELYLTLPAAPPWLREPLTVHLDHRRPKPTSAPEPAPNADDTCQNRGS